MGITSGNGHNNILSGFNLDDFDEEINGINLSKLFSIYGPNSIENKRSLRKNTADNEARHDTVKGYRSGRSMSP